MSGEALLVVLDFDGTVKLLPHHGNSTWSRLDLKTLDLDRIIMTRNNREYFLRCKREGTYTEAHERIWLDLSVQAMVESKVRREHIAQVFVNNEAHMRPGFVDFLRWLKSPRNSNPVHVIINSYGFVQIIDHILREVGVRDLVDDIIAMDMVFDERGHFVGFRPDSVVVTSIKGQRTAEYMAKNGISPERAVGIGDSDGDAKIVPPGGHRLLLAFDEKQVATYGHHFDSHVISHDWTGPQAWLADRFKLW